MLIFSMIVNVMFYGLYIIHCPFLNCVWFCIKEQQQSLCLWISHFILTLSLCLLFTPDSSATSFYSLPPPPQTTTTTNKQNKKRHTKNNTFWSSWIFLFSERFVRCCFPLSATFGNQLWADASLTHYINVHAHTHTHTHAHTLEYKQCWDWVETKKEWKELNIS